ncbi:MAG: hypothetical protein N2D54_03510 [Chloroflexota bacterium]
MKLFNGKTLFKLMPWLLVLSLLLGSSVISASAMPSSQKSGGEGAANTRYCACHEPDLTVTKSNNVGGNLLLGGNWTWSMTVKNEGFSNSAVFANGQVILSDQLPDTNIIYGSVSVGSVVNMTNSGNIGCEIDANSLLTCIADGADVTIWSTTGTFTVSFTATPSGVGTFTNPTGGSCSVDPNGSVIELNDGNNNCNTDSVTVTAPDLIVTKSAPSKVVPSENFNWLLKIENIGDADAVFGNFDIVLRDDMPAAASYGVPTIGYNGGVTGAINCTTPSPTMICSGDGGLVIPDGGIITVTVPVYAPGYNTTLINPEGGSCEVDADDDIIESDETNNSCSTNTVIVTSVIFTDGFESGDLSKWSGYASAAVCDYLCVKKIAKIEGLYGLQVNLKNRFKHYVTDISPVAETEYHARFKINTANLTINANKLITLFVGRMGQIAPFHVQMRKHIGKHQMRARIRRDDGGYEQTSWTQFLKSSNVPIEIAWKAAGNPGANNGYIKLYINDTLRVKKLNIDNDTYVIRAAKLGIVRRLSPNAVFSGYINFDDFASDSFSYIGP